MNQQASGRSSTLVTYMRFQVRTLVRSMLFWTVGLSIYAGVVVLIYPSVKDTLNLDAIPENLRTAFNINDFTQLASFLSSELFGVILPLVIPFFGIIILSDVVAGAEERGRLDILLGNPIPRYHLIIGSFIVTAAALLGMVGVIGVVIWAVSGLQQLGLSINQSLRATFALWPVALAFGSLALAISTLARRRALAVGVPAGIVFLMFLLNVIGKLAPAVSGVRYVSVYHYYGTAITDGIWWIGAAILLGATLILLAFAIVSFNRRDIYT
jgi:ABC-2 type transport system permease protein